MATELVRRARKRRSSRGAAATEGVIVATLFLLLFAGLWGALTFHHEKIRVMRDARAQAWNYALGACQGGGGAVASGGGQVLDDLASESDNAGSNPPPDTENQYANIEDSKLSEDSGYAASEVAGSVKMPGLIGGASYTPTGKMYLRCNEDPPPDNLLEIGKRAMNIAVGVFGF